MKKLLILFLLIFISGCVLTPERISKNPDLALNECNKLESLNEKTGCINTYAKSVAPISKQVAVELCNNLEGYPKNKCFFDVSNELESSNKLDDSIEVCKLIEKPDFSEWCESRRNKESISVAPPL